MLDLNALLQVMAAMREHEIGEVIITHDRVELRRTPAAVAGAPGGAPGGVPGGVPGGAPGEATGGAAPAQAAAQPAQPVQSTGPAPGTSAGAAAAPARETFAIKAPIPGVVHCHPAARPKGGPLPGVGERVAARTVVAVLEAMKMANEVMTPRAGIIRELAVQNGQKVKAGQVLMVLEAVED